MATFSMSDLLKNRMSATKQASELTASDEVYEQIFQEPPAPSQISVRELLLSELTPFHTADIGFKPYSAEKLQAFADQLQEEGLLVRIIVRPMSEDNRYEILAGHNRVSAAKLAGWKTIPAEVVQADDARAVVIATSTNLIQRQELSIVERGKAYRALLDAKNRQGQWHINDGTQTFGEIRQKFETNTEQSGPDENRPRYNARKLVSQFFGVTEYEIRKAIKLTQLIPELQELLENSPKRLNLSCADLIADYDAASQSAFIDMCTIEGYQLNKAAVSYIVKCCPPPTADRQAVFAAWRKARSAAEKRLSAPPKKISFDRKKFAPYLEQMGGDAELENLFLEFLRQHVKLKNTQTLGSV